MAQIVEMLRRHGVDAKEHDSCIAVVIEDDVHLAFDVGRRIVSIYDLVHDVHLTYPLSDQPQGMPAYECWLREMNSAKETWKRVRHGLPVWLRD